MHAPNQIQIAPKNFEDPEPVDEDLEPSIDDPRPYLANLKDVLEP